MMTAMEQKPDKQWLTVADVAAILGTSSMTVRRMIKRNELPAPRGQAAQGALLGSSTRLSSSGKGLLDVELAAMRQRLGGVRHPSGLVTGPVVSGYGEELHEKVEQQFPGMTVDPGGPTVGAHLRALSATHDALDELEQAAREIAREMRADQGFQASLEALDEAERFEAEARELARRIRRDRRDEELLKRAREILDEDDD